MSDEGRLLAKALREAPRRGKARVYSEALRRRAAAWYRERRAQGAGVRELGEVLGVHPVLLTTWARRYARTGFRQVELVCAPGGEHEPRLEVLEPVSNSPAGPAVLEASPARPGLTLISPRGWRLEGLEPAHLTVLIEALS